MPLPPKLLKRGITDMVRVSDARMSGTAYGPWCCTSRPKPLRAACSRWWKTAISSSLDVAKRRLELLVPETSSRKAQKMERARPPLERDTGGCISIMCCRRTKARSGFLVGKSGDFSARQSLIFAEGRTMKTGLTKLLVARCSAALACRGAYWRSRS